ncbi:MAG TPA: carbon monoxide dehydrogenase subunit G [Candidatus Cybelea sp.]|nr:carbon monoxide dehydrogenase subunit G [Candidatus Cybelea sp.]
MDMSGEQTIPAPRETVWAALNDPEILKQAIPGCESVEKLSDTQFVASVVARVGPVKASFKGKVTLSDIDPPNGYTIEGEGQGGVAGFGKGGAKVALQDVDGGTLLRYTAHASVGGKLAQIGSRLVDSAARKMADDFFAQFNAIVSAGTQVIDAEATGSAGPDMEPILQQAAAHPPGHPIAPTVPPAVTPAQGLPPWVWIGGLIVLILIILALYAQRG